MSDLQDVIATAVSRAYNAGYKAGIEKSLESAKFVSFDHSDFDTAILAVSDLEEELQITTNFYHSDRQITLSEQGQEGDS